MEVTLCRLPISLHLICKSSPLMRLSQCCRPAWRRRLTYGVISLCFTLFFLTVTHVVSWRGSLYSQRGWDGRSDDDVLLHRKKSSYDFQKTRGVRQSLDYTDPVLVDFPFRNTEKNEENEKKKTNSEEELDLSYGVVIDCGSSGSRVFAYSWHKHSGNPYELLKIQQLKSDNGDPVVMKITPGIATRGNRPHTASSYLKPLLDYAAEHIPPEKHKETPLYVLCTAGMRMLSKRMRNAILINLQTSIPNYSKFQFLPSHAEVISGMTEGLYFWMGLNYILGNLHQEHYLPPDIQTTDMKQLVNDSKTGRPTTVGVIDMGGASLQIAFEVGSQDLDDDLSKRTIDINLGCDEHKSEHEYKVFVETFLHKGGNTVRKLYEKDIFFNFTASGKKMNNTIDIQDPCLPLGFVQELSYTLDTKEQIPYKLHGTGDYKVCRRLLSSYLEKSDCDENSSNCVLNGKSLPTIDYKNNHFFGSSEFFYCMDDVLRIGGAYNKLQYDLKAAEYCSTPWNETWGKYENGFYKHADANRIRFQCFKSAWVSQVLHEGLNFPTDYQHLTSVKYINESEIQWTLGALLYKTRFLPLREIQLQSLQAKQEKTYGIMDKLYYPFAVMSHYPIVFFLCIAIVLFCLLISVIRFCLHHNKKNVASLRRVGSSVAYFVHEEA